MGIFQIQNTASGRSFIGSSKDLPAILNRHQWQLKLGAHPNADLQRDWNDSAPTKFAFTVLDTLAPSTNQTMILPRISVRCRRTLDRKTSAVAGRTL